MAQRRTKNVKLAADGKVREYRLRQKADPTEYLNYYNGSNGSGQRPTFNKHGKVWKTDGDIEDAIFDYQMRRRTMLKKLPATEVDPLFPELEIVISYVVVESVRAPRMADPKLLDQLVKFSEKLKNNSWTPVYRLAEKQVSRGQPFRYLFVTKGPVDRKIVGIQHAARIGAFNRMKDDTECVFAVGDSETDLMYARVGLADSLVTIWDFKTLKIIYEKS